MEQIAEAADLSTFDKLATPSVVHPFRETSERADRFFREGRAGAWRETLTPDQARRIVDKHGEVMQFGYLRLPARLNPTRGEPRARPSGSRHPWQSAAGCTKRGRTRSGSHGRRCGKHAADHGDRARAERDQPVDQHGCVARRFVDDADCQRIPVPRMGEHPRRELRVVAGHGGRRPRHHVVRVAGEFRRALPPRAASAAPCLPAPAERGGRRVCPSTCRFPGRRHRRPSRRW